MRANGPLACRSNVASGSGGDSVPSIRLYVDPTVVSMEKLCV